MLYTLKCNPAQNPACGEWDYLTYTYQYQPTIDSSTLTGYNYEVNGTSPDSFSYLTSPQFQLSPYSENKIIYNDTVSYFAATAGAGASSATYPFKTSAPVSRTQYLWTASELSALGLTAGNISGIQFNVSNSGGMMKHLSIRMKNSALDSLTASDYETSGFTLCYDANTNFTNAGWNSIAFYTPFNWDGVSNVVMEVTYDNETSSSDYLISSDVASWKNSINVSGNEHSAHFNDANYISIPAGAFASVDSEITIAFWFKGDSFLQDRTAFEAYDQYDHRVLNAHLPWSDGNIYWDAGTSLVGTYDRIYHAANVADYENNWHYWTFTKNCSTGSMKIYKDGELWFSGTGLTRLMNNIKTFWIGSALWNIDVSANGNIDEFAIWNKELDQATIQEYMYKDLDANHPYHSNLLVYYQFNDDNLFTVKDESGNGFDGSIIGAQLPLTNSSELFRNISNVDQRAQIKFEQGVYDASYITQTLFDTIPNNPVSLVLFNNPSNPALPTDTQLVWLPFYQYVFDSAGNITDSVFISSDTTIHLQTTTYNSGAVPTLKRWEIGRYITPYGINLSLGTGWTWTYDVSDYATLLHDSVFLTAGNWQELLDVKFYFIEGTPPRDPISVQNLWNGDFGWGTTTENDLAAKKVLIPGSAKNSRVKLRITGHGEDQNNCAEFCNNTAYFKVNGEQKYSRPIWRPTCPLNPLYPQGGTWVYERANWCPGAEVTTFDWELTPFVTPGDSSLLDIDLNPYSGSTSGWANYVTESQLITYSEPNFSLDAEVYDIMQPTRDQMYLRHNPICNNPLIVIRNDGSTPLTSLTITYGIEGATQSVYQWAGNLNFLDTAQVRLGAFLSPQGGNGNEFVARVSFPNGGTDENPQNDAETTYINFPAQYPSHVYIELKTNNNPEEDSYILSDDQGNVILSKNNLDANTVYKDTLELANGCYTMRMTDTGEDGLSFWANPDQGSGYFRIRNAETGAVIKSFGTDFGEEIYWQFTVGYFLNTDEIPQVKIPTLDVYPNPSDGEVWADLFLPERSDAEILVTDLNGNRIYHQSLHQVLSQGLTIDLSKEPSGVYFLHVMIKNQILTRKILITK